MEEAGSGEFAPQPRIRSSFKSFQKESLIMGSRDIRNKETKKPKKDTKQKTTIVSPDAMITPPKEVEVIKKRRKQEEE
jgi:hypothetical protein